ncbi:hypothetical protein TUBRATIS_11680 [Tubulinosema ratisbonensis]|uniref:Uncharacterized protein n=1 Tax=Tubulinosema ratisbonensis TaxID=291195 RepID=A0A437AMW9_9MICR|nr:hypothetical protein TUBRATIS_11680 [Tubulinosema ratisbonensis]
MKYLKLFITNISLFNLTLLKIELIENKAIDIEKQDKKDICMSNHLRQYNSTFTINYKKIFRSLKDHYVKLFANDNIKDLKVLFVKAKEKSLLNLNYMSSQRLNIILKKKIPYLIEIYENFMFLSLMFHNNFLFNSAYFINKFEEKPIGGLTLLDYFKSDRVFGLVKCIRYLLYEFINEPEFNPTFQKNYEAESKGTNFKKYLNDFIMKNENIIKINKSEYLKKFRIPDQIIKKKDKKPMEMKMHLFLFESIFLSPKSLNTLILFPEFELFRMKLEHTKNYFHFQDIHYFLTLLILKVEYTLLLLFKKEVCLKTLAFIPKYIVQILENIVLTGRSFVLIFFKNQVKSDSFLVYYKYFELLACISYHKMHGEDILAQNNITVNDLNMDFYCTNLVHLNNIIN